MMQREQERAIRSNRSSFIGIIPSPHFQREQGIGSRQQEPRLPRHMQCARRIHLISEVTTKIPMLRYIHPRSEEQPGYPRNKTSETTSLQIHSLIADRVSNPIPGESFQITFTYNNRFLFLSSGPSSSPSRSAVSAGFSRLCTLLAILLRRVGGAVSIPLNGYRAPGSCHPASLELA